MHPNITAIERAFQLAKSGLVTKVQDIRTVLNREGYSSDAINYRSIRDQLRALISKASKEQVTQLSQPTPPSLRSTSKNTQSECWNLIIKFSVVVPCNGSSSTN